MRNLFIIAILTGLGSLAFLNGNMERDRAEAASFTSYNNTTVPLVFSINEVTETSLEFVLNRRPDDPAMYLNFQFAPNWDKGQYDLTLEDISEESKRKSVAAQQRFNQKVAQFRTDTRGRQINSYRFDNEIVTGKQGGMYMKMAYNGPQIPLINNLTLDHDIWLPRKFSKRFDAPGSVVFLGGKRVRLNRQENAFYVPIEFRRRKDELDRD